MGTNKPEQLPKHFHLICAELLFSVEEGMNTVKMNTIISTEVQNLQLHHLGKAQQQVQALLHQKMGDTKYKVEHLVILSVSYLGRMTEEQFHKRPQPPKLSVVSNDIFEKGKDPLQ